MKLIKFFPNNPFYFFNLFVFNGNFKFGMLQNFCEYIIDVAVLVDIEVQGIMIGGLVVECLGLSFH
jgi:hypothetical protein